MRRWKFLPTGFYSLGRGPTNTVTALTVIQLGDIGTHKVEIVRAGGSQCSTGVSAATELMLYETLASDACVVTQKNPTPATPGMPPSQQISALTGVTATEEMLIGRVPWSAGVNVVSNGAVYLPVPEERPILGTERIGLKHTVAPTGDWVHQIDWIEHNY